VVGSVFGDRDVWFKESCLIHDYEKKITS